MKVALVERTHLPMQEIQQSWVRSLGWENPLEESIATHSSILAWRISMDRGAWRTMVHTVVKSQTRMKQGSTHPSRIKGHF